MNFPRSLHLFLSLLVIGLLCLTPHAQGYDEPVFSAAPFDDDGVFLSPADQQTLLEALASIACNFRSNASIDSDLVEKSLAIALTIAPFHRNARQAHEALADGNIPETTTFFDSRSAVSEALWGIASGMIAPPVEPEELKLAPLLMEISLLTHPEPTIERILTYEKTSRGRSNSWAGFVSLQPDVYRSNERLANLKREAKGLKSGEPSFFAVKPEPDSTTMPEVAKPATPVPKITASAISEDVREIAGSFPTTEGYLAGTFTIHVRAPAGPAELNRFPFLTERPVEKYPILPLLMPQDNAVDLMGINFPMQKTMSYGISWQQGAIGEASFGPATPLPEEREDRKIRSALQVILTLKSITDAKSLNPEIGILGAFERASESVRPVEDPAALLKSAESLEMPYLLVPSNALAPLVETLSSTEELELLFFSDLIAYTTLDEAYQFITLPEITQAMTEASQIFAEIETVSVRMPLPELARNAKVQERLESILALVPNHFSARAMLEFGRGESTGTSGTPNAISQIDELISPYFALQNERSADLNILRNALDETDLELTRIRTTLEDGMRSYHTKATEVLEAAEIYLGLTNKTTSIAEQRLRELHELLGEMNREREGLGLTPFSAKN